MLLIIRKYSHCSFIVLAGLMLALASSPVWSGKLYKWVDKEGQTHYSQIPPNKDQIKDKSEVSEKTDALMVTATRRGDYAYCGDMKLPGPLYDAKSLLLNLGLHVDMWERSLKENERSLRDQLRELDRQNKQKHDQYSYRSTGTQYTDFASERRRSTSRRVMEYKCALAWAEKQKSEYSDIKKELAHDVKGAQESHKTIIDTAHKECGFEPKDYASPNYDQKKSTWKKCMRPFEYKIRMSKRKLRDLRSQKNRLE